MSCACGAGPDRGAVIYSRFAQLAQQYTPERQDGYPAWEQVFNRICLEDLFKKFTSLAQRDAQLPSFVVAQGTAAAPPEVPLQAADAPPTYVIAADPPPPPERSYNLHFEVDSNTFTLGSRRLLGQALEHLLAAEDAAIEIHGYTD
jgi:outer membrane protein OmpA-like peptidoglycan-associated protein